MRDNGHAILLVSSDLDEIFTLSDRVLVMFESEANESIHQYAGTREKYSMMQSNFLKQKIVRYLITSLSLFLILLVLLNLADASFFEASQAFLKSAFGGRRYAYLYVTISRCALITGMAIAALIAFRAGLINIGGEGQLVVGGFAAAFISIYSGITGVPGVALAILSAMIGGGLWAVLAGLMKLKLGVPILVGTLLLNYPARYITSCFFWNLMDKSLWLPFIEGTRLDVGFIFILIVYAFVLVYSHRTVSGYQAKMAGFSIEFAATSGVDIFRTVRTLFLSGAIAGLVGAIAVLGIHHRFTDGMLVQPLYAWTGIVAALLINLIPWAVLPASFFFASLTSGASGMERTADVPKEIAIIIQGIIKRILP